MGRPIDDLLREYINDIDDMERKARDRRLNAPTEPPPPTTSGMRPRRPVRLPDLPPLHNGASKGGRRGKK